MRIADPALAPDKRIGATAYTAQDWSLIVALLALAAMLRMLFFNGPFGSDDLVYLNRSVQISEGIWSSANYNGALRYGFNIPAGFFIFLFGINTVSANLWPLFCSIAEIGAVYVIARSLWGRQAALYAALILAFMPLHVASATRIHADPVVACFLTLSFVLFYFAEKYRSRSLYVLTGLAMGLVFWTKEIAAVTLFAFVFYPLIWRKLETRWAYVVGAGIGMLLAHFALMQFIAGDPFHAIKVVTGQISRSFIHGGDVAEDGVWFYFRYLFLDIKHLWLAGIIAGAAVIVAFYRRRQIGPGTGYVVFWLLGLLAVLSFTPVSLDPLKFVMKQSNYLTLFLAPLALLAGYQLAHTPRRLALAILITTVGGGFVLAGLEQQAYHVFTSNSKAAVAFAQNNRGIPMVGSVNNGNIAAAYSILHRDRALATQIRYMNEMPHGLSVIGPGENPAAPVFAVLDRETMGWGKNDVRLTRAPLCWKAVGPLVPIGFGPGQSLVSMLQILGQRLPRFIGQRLTAPLAQLAQASPAVVYSANLSDFWCERGGAPTSSAP